MTRQEQIEEMAKFISNYADKHDWELHEPEFEDLAIELYNAGYRNTFTSDLANDTQKAYKEGYEKAQSELKTEIERLKAENETYCKQINQAYDTGYDDGYESCQDDIKKADELLKEYE